jgi:glycosyltransferase involved in cell wall biosynthesis
MANIPYVLSGLEAASVGLLPTTNPGDEGTETLDPEERLVFAAMVRGAAHVLTRTIAAAEACREWGAQSVEVVLIAADPIARASSESGRVRLLCPHGDVESKALKKVEAALRRGRLPNLEFTLVDSSRDASEAEILTWGDTTVRRVGGGHNGAVERLLRTADVLLAPSSGARLDAFIEAALASGVWIVLGTEDANREFVHEGVNGFVLNGGGRELRDVLTMLNADPVRFRSSPRSPSPPISAEQQAAALLNVYRMAVGID